MLPKKFYALIAAVNIIKNKEKLMTIREYRRLKAALYAFYKSEYRFVAIDRYKLNDDGSVFLFKVSLTNYDDCFDYFYVTESGYTYEETSELNRINPFSIRRIPEYLLRKGMID